MSVDDNYTILLLITSFFAFAVIPITFSQIYLLLCNRNIYLFLSLTAFGIIQSHILQNNDYGKPLTMSFLLCQVIVSYFKL